MQGSSNNSFIPKRRNSKRQRSKPNQKFFLVTVLVYSSLFASLLAAGAVFFYKNFTISQLQYEVTLLDREVNTFSVQNFEQVQEFDAILKNAKDRVDHTVSVVSILDELDRVTAQPIQISNLELERRDDQDLMLTITFSTETLDAALFQRKVVTTNSNLFSNVEISEIVVQAEIEAVSDDQVAVVAAVTFVAKLSIPLTAALYDPAEARRTDIGTPQQASLQGVFGNSVSESFDSSEREPEKDGFDIDQIIQPEEVEVNETAL
ncbi:MAG: hypothetical protein ACI9SY_000531 [Candidatus Paceibacteria bacterium]|jgi:hypothetical protein